MPSSLFDRSLTEVFSAILNRQLRRSSITLKASAAETASTTSTSYEVGDAGAISLVVDVTVVSGTTPTLSVVIEGSDDDTNWHTLGTFGATFAAPGGTAPANITGVSTIRATMPCARYVRSRSVIGGTTPSFTYAVTGSVT